jgi:hypothetical protein
MEPISGVEPLTLLITNSTPLSTRFLHNRNVYNNLLMIVRMDGRNLLRLSAESQHVILSHFGDALWIWPQPCH